MIYGSRKVLIMKNMAWKQVGRQNYSAIMRDGSRYTISRLLSVWMVSFLPTGSAEGGRVALAGSTLTAAKQACAEHSRIGQLVEA